MEIGELTEAVRIGLFISCNLAPAPCIQPHNMLVSIINPKETLKLAYRSYKEDFKKFLNEEYEMHRDYLKSRL